MVYFKKKLIKKNYVIKLCGVHDSVCEFGELTMVTPVRGFSDSFFFLLIKLDYMIVYFSLYCIVKKLVLKKHVIKF
jgi:hypothetical protein